MSNTQQDTEIILGTGRMLVLFFALVLVCAVFFAVGFSLGRKSASLGLATVTAAQASTPAAIVRPGAGKTNPPAAPPSTDLSFYKAVEQKTANSQLATPEPKSTTPPPSEPEKNSAPDATAAAPSGNPYYVQVAAVTHQEDAEALVEALKKKQYPAFVTAGSPPDKLYRVQVGPFVDIKDAELTRGRLVGDGYNPILKK